MKSFSILSLTLAAAASALTIPGDESSAFRLHEVEGPKAGYLSWLPAENPSNIVYQYTFNADVTEPMELKFANNATDGLIYLVNDDAMDEYNPRILWLLETRSRPEWYVMASKYSYIAEGAGGAGGVGGVRFDNWTMGGTPPAAYGAAGDLGYDGVYEGMWSSCNDEASGNSILLFGNQPAAGEEGVCGSSNTGYSMNVYYDFNFA